MPTLQFSNELHFIFSQAINASPIFFLPLTGTIQFSSPGLDHLCLLATLGGGEIEYTSEVFFVKPAALVNVSLCKRKL